MPSYFKRWRKSSSGGGDKGMEAELESKKVDQKQARDIAKAAQGLKITCDQSLGLSKGFTYCEFRAEDVVIAIMGITGTGKSTFINQLTRSGVVGHGLRSCKPPILIHFKHHKD
jgi:ribosome biogenesis GTPase A